MVLGIMPLNAMPLNANKSHMWFDYGCVSMSNFDAHGVRKYRVFTFIVHLRGKSQVIILCHRLIFTKTNNIGSFQNWNLCKKDLVRDTFRKKLFTTSWQKKFYFSHQFFSKCFFLSNLLKHTLLFLPSNVIRHPCWLTSKQLQSLVLKYLKHCSRALNFQACLTRHSIISCDNFHYNPTQGTISRSLSRVRMEVIHQLACVFTLT